jgi:hypothetical protein
MRHSQLTRPAVIGLGLVIIVWGAGIARPGGDRDGLLPTCNGISDCADGRGPPAAVCNHRSSEGFVGPGDISDLADGVSSDGRGSYIQGTDGVKWSIVIYEANIILDKDNRNTAKPRRLSVNLSHPVPGGRSVPLGIITDGDDNGLVTELGMVGDTLPNALDIPVGQTRTAAQMNVGFHIDGRFHILQMGPQAYGHCHDGPNVVNGTGTSSGTIYRTSRTKWVLDLPAGSVGRLFDVHNTKGYAVDKGLYYVHLHYEIGN